MTDASQDKIPVSFAMQGGGQLGAYQLGILCAFFKDPRIGEIEIMTGSSAGGLNALFGSMILMMGVRGQADVIGRECWPGLSLIPTNTQEVVGWIKKTVFGESGTLRAAADWAFAPLDRLINSGAIHQLESMGTVAVLAPLMMALPEKHKFKLFKALLGDRLEKMIDFEKLRASKGPELYIAGASTKEDSPVYYRRKHANGMVGMITSAVPFVFPSIRTMVGRDEHVFVDGAMAANPPIDPIVTHGGDCIVLKLMDAKEESYASSFHMGIHLLRMFKDTIMNDKIRGAQEVTRNIETAESKGVTLDDKKKCRFHMLSDERAVQKYGLASALNFNAGMARQMFDDGFKAGQEWLTQNFGKLGKESTYIPPSTNPDDYENGLPCCPPASPPDRPKKRLWGLLG